MSVDLKRSLAYHFTFLRCTNYGKSQDENVNKY